jgi:general secretion pathway protein B
LQTAATVIPPAAVVTEQAGQPLYKNAPAADSKKARKRAAARSVANDAGMPQSSSQRRDAPEALQTLPEISITGIAWQDERSLRRAVLNGVLVGEGAEVAGARVVEIRESKVRLSRGGQLFEVVMSSGQSR